MIPRITRGGSGYGALSYDHGPGRRDEHRNAHKVGGNIAGKTWQQRSASMDDHVRRMHPKLTKPITRTSLRLAPEDRNLTDREWRAVAERYVQKMGYADGPWEAVRHADDHIHLTMSRVRWDGSVVDQWKDKTRAQSAVRDIEREHGLVDASSRYNRDLPQLSRNDVERSARASELTGRVVDPEKQQLRDRVAEAERFSGGTRAGFERELTARGISFRANESGPTERNPRGKMNGYSYGLDGHTDANGDAVWFKASQLGQRYGWAQTEQRLERLRTAPVAQGGATDGDDAPARHVTADPETTVRDPQGHDGDTVVGGEKRAERERDGDERDNELVPDRTESEQTTERDASGQARDAEESGDGQTARRNERIDTDRDQTRADRSDRAAAALDDRKADRQDRSTQAAEQRGEDRRQTEEARERSPERDAQQREPNRTRDRSTESEQRQRHEEATNRPRHAADDQPQQATQRDTERTVAARDADTRDREPVAAEASKADERPEQRPERVNAPEGNERDQRSPKLEKEPDEAQRPANSKDRARERAQQWAQERRERSQTPQRYRSPGERTKPAQRDDEPPRRQSDAPEHRASSVPTREHTATTEEPRRTGVVRSGKDDGHADRRPDHNTSPEKPERREGERSMSNNDERDVARDAKEESRERAEQWAADRKERSQDNDRDRSAERDR